jgi:hypothetical protein
MTVQVDAIADRLRKADYSVSTNVRLDAGIMAAVAASRTCFSWKGFVILSQHVVIARYESAGVQEAEALFKSGFAHARRGNRIPLPRGCQFAFIVIPILVTARPSQELIAYVSKVPPKHWCLFELPTVLDPNSGVAAYYHGRVLWGGLYFSNMRNVISRFIDNAGHER